MRNELGRSWWHQRKMWVKLPWVTNRKPLMMTAAEWRSSNTRWIMNNNKIMSYSAVNRNAYGRNWLFNRTLPKKTSNGILIWRLIISGQITGFCAVRTLSVVHDADSRCQPVAPCAQVRGVPISVASRRRQFYQRCTWSQRAQTFFFLLFFSFARLKCIFTRTHETASALAWRNELITSSPLSWCTRLFCICGCASRWRPKRPQRAVNRSEQIWLALLRW